ncbi:F-box protein SKIP14-like [Oryza sativa Japonica Group]|uniref:F-box protein SKIP14-like n=1 Tax=Oryza sativa subsp. japonica TaxID=39947 RepID=UPI00339D2C8E
MLSILGCPRLTLDGLISNLKSFNTNAVFGIKHLRVGTLFSLRKEQYEELLSLLNTDKTQEVHNRGPKIPSYRYAPDIEMCPICQNYKLVYDCRDEGCDDRGRGCAVCILRCYECGRCVDKLAFKESFSLDWVCPNCQEKKDLSPPMK